MGFGVWGLEFRVWGLGLRVRGLRIRVRGLGLGFGVYGFLCGSKASKRLIQGFDRKFVWLCMLLRGYVPQGFMVEVLQVSC